MLGIFFTCCEDLKMKLIYDHARHSIEKKAQFMEVANAYCDGENPCN